MNESELIDMFLIIPIFVCIGTIAWIMHRETTRSKKNLEISQKKIDDEYDSLALRISERTQELLDSRKLRDEERERLVHFGKLSKGIFHDLMSPLSSISLSIEQLRDNPHSISETQELITKATSASKRMSDFMESLRTTISTASPKEMSASTHELSVVLDLLAYKARMAGVRIVVDHSDTVELPIHPVRFQQLLLNVISNAIESCELVDSLHEHFVRIQIKKKKNQAIISITDTGAGIDPEHANDILVRPFSTKKKGTGVGLITVRSIVQDELKGTVTIKNAPTRGALCEIVIPISP